MVHRSPPNYFTMVAQKLNENSDKTICMLAFILRIRDPDPAKVSNTFKRICFLNLALVLLNVSPKQEDIERELIVYHI